MSAADWTDERVALMRRLRVLEGQSAGQIAKALSLTGARFTRNAVIGKLARLGIDPSVAVDLNHERARIRARIAGKKRPAVVRKPLALAPPVAPEPVKLRAPPAKGANSVRFIDRTRRQCAMFCDGESGPDGFVCGEPVAVNAYCASCAGICYVPVKPRAAA